MTVKPCPPFRPGRGNRCGPPCDHFSTRRSSRKSANSTCLVASSILPASSAASNNHCAVCCHAWHSWMCSVIKDEGANVRERVQYGAVLEDDGSRQLCGPSQSLNPFGIHGLIVFPPHPRQALAHRIFVTAAGIAVYDLGQLVAEFVGQPVAACEVMQGTVARP